MREPVDVDGQRIKALVQEASSIIGDVWIQRRLKADQLRRDEATKRNHRRRMVRYAPPHLLVQWLAEYQAWEKACTAGEVLPNQSVILLATFASNLLKVKSAKGFEHVLSRLLVPSQFLAAGFEIEVATAYLNMRWEVEFVETGDQKSPDLRVTRTDNYSFWVECKRRDELSGRDEIVERFWKELKGMLYRQWGPARSNLALTLRSSSDPLLAEISTIGATLLRAAAELLASESKGAMLVVGGDEVGKYSYELKYLTDPDVAIPFQGGEAPADHMFEFMGEVSVSGSDGSLSIRNPKYFAYKNETPPDRYLGALNSFKAAVSQLPEEGRGVVWVRVPYPVGYPAAKADLERLALALEGELTAGQNTRVNAIVLSARFFSSEPNGGREALTYRHTSAVIEHPQPRQKFPPLAD